MQMETTSVYRIDDRTGFAVPADKTFTVPVQPGWKQGTRITFEVAICLQALRSTFPSHNRAVRSLIGGCRSLLYAVDPLVRSRCL